MKLTTLLLLLLTLATCTHHYTGSPTGGVIDPDDDDDLPRTIEIHAPTAGSTAVRPLTASSRLEVFSL
jgi:hypothetical protein